ncbi:MAG: sulfatase-like hydrolase/transferase [Thermoguttaceae bacterium]
MPRNQLCRLLPAFLIAVTFLASLGALAGRLAPAAEKPARPDILLIMPDQMRGDCLSVLEHPVVQTPNFDRLAEQGVLFRRAYSTVPSCIPARYALMTGLYPQTSGVVGFRQKPIDCPTMPQLLRDTGYRTVLVGREMHQIADAAGLGYDTGILGSTYVSDQYTADLKKAVPEIPDFRSWVEKTLGLSYNHWQATPWPLADDLHPTSWIVRQARKVVAESPAEKPLFLTASFYAPHPPLFPPKEYFDRYLAMELPAPAHGDWVDWSLLTPKGADGGHRVILEGETLRKAQAGYFGLIEHIDREVGPLIADFQARSRAAGRPWLIVLTTDHGEMLGDHGYFRKCEPLEGSANIPFILCGSPELGFTPGRRSFQPVCLEDVLPTLAALAAADCPPVDGVNLVPALQGKQGQIRPWLHFEHADCYSRAQAFHALTDGRYKYIWRPLDGREHLFDLRQDPREEHDLSTDPAQGPTLANWRGVLVERLASRPEGFSDGQRLIPGRPYPPLSGLAPIKKKRPAKSPARPRTPDNQEMPQPGLRN